VKSFDLFACSLQGVQLIDASAGTGKTFTITGLVLRLLLEVHLPVEKILVVTFTEAATKELRAKTRAMLRRALRHARARSVRGSSR
jgi:exodeoxyribonuclease V beta subunit